MNFELIIVVWDNGVFEMRDRIEALDTHSLREQFEVTIGMIESKLKQKEKNRYIVDDDIPF